MGDRRIVVGSSEWKLPDGDVTDTLAQITRALETGTVATLELLDADGATMTVHLNGKTVQTVAVDLNGSPRPSEISGGDQPASQ